MIVIEDEACTEYQHHIGDKTNITKLEVFQEVIDEDQHCLSNEMTFDNRSNEEVKIHSSRRHKPRKFNRNPTKALSNILQDKFNQLTDEQKQKVVNYTMDTILDRVEERRYCYHGYVQQQFQELNCKNYVIPENEKLSKINYQSARKENVLSYPKQKFKGFEYIPPIARHKFQISIWKADEYGVVKTYSKYFTPNNKCNEEKDFIGF